MSPAKQIVNPLGEENEAADYGNVVLVCQYDPAQSGNLINGNVVCFEDLTAPATGPVLIKKTLHGTVDFRMIGVIVDAPTGGYAPGQACHVLVEGFAQVLFDANNTVVNNLGVQSATTDGTLTNSSTATVGKTMASILEAVTIASGTALVPCYVHKM